MIGEILTNPRHYIDSITNQFRTKHLLVLGITRGGDLVVRLLTSRQHGRPVTPACNHGDPYPSFYLGILGGPLTEQSWLDLRYHEDLDCAEVSLKLQQAEMTVIGALPGATLVSAMECAAAAPDTTRLQEQAIRDTLSTLR